jgi:RNA polymerase sigma-70 factor (ECF subfamily)
VPSYLTHNDQELLAAIRHDDEGAFSELFKRYGKKVYRMAYCRIHSKEASEEIVQNLFVSLWDKRGTLLINNVSSYFFTAVKHKALNILESRVVQKKYWDYYKNFIPHQENITERTVEFNELLEAIEKRLECLPEKSKKVFMLNRLEGHSVSEIADLLNLSKKTIQYHLTRSLKELRLQLKHFIISLGMWLTMTGIN